MSTQTISQVFSAGTKVIPNVPGAITSLSIGGVAQTVNVDYVLTSGSIQLTNALSTDQDITIVYTDNKGVGTGVGTGISLEQLQTEAANEAEVLVALEAYGTAKTSDLASISGTVTGQVIEVSGDVATPAGYTRISGDGTVPSAGNPWFFGGDMVAPGAYTDYSAKSAWQEGKIACHFVKTGSNKQLHWGGLQLVSSTNTFAACNDIYEYDETTQVFTYKATGFSGAMFGASLLHSNGYIYSIGGAVYSGASGYGSLQGTQTLQNFISKLNLSTYGTTSQTNLTASRWRHGVCELPNGNIWVVGGWGVSGILSSTEIFNPTNNTVSAGPALPLGFAPGVVFSDGTNAWILGGDDNVGMTNKVYKYDIAVGTVALVADTTLPYTIGCRAGFVKNTDGTVTYYDSYNYKFITFNPTSKTFSVGTDTCKQLRLCPNLIRRTDGNLQLWGGYYAYGQHPNVHGNSLIYSNSALATSGTYKAKKT